MQLLTLIPANVQAAGPMVLNPYAQMNAQIDSSSKRIAAFLSEIDSAVDRGVSIHNAVRNPSGGRLQDDRIEDIMNSVIRQSRMAGFIHGSRIGGKQFPATYGRDAADRARVRASKVNAWMKDTTKKHLTVSPDSDYVLSGDRALAATRYEAGRSYFQGLKDALRGTKHSKKWITSAAESCEECQDNEDAGLVDVDDDFESGDAYPPIHLHCSCWIVVS